MYVAQWAVDGSFAWRFGLGAAAVPALAQLVLVRSLPESPRWLAMRERTEEARCAPRALRAGDVAPRGRRGRCDPRHTEDGGWRGARQAGSHHASDLQHCVAAEGTLLGCGLQMLQQLSGINTVMCARRLRAAGGVATARRRPKIMCVRRSLTRTAVSARRYYSGSILSQTGFSDDRHAVAIAAFVSFANFCGTVIGMLVVDRNGGGRHPVYRRVAAMLGVLSYASRSGAGDGSRWVVAGALAGYLLVFAPGMGLLPWVINAEVYPSGTTLGNAAATGGQLDMQSRSSVHSSFRSPRASGCRCAATCITRPPAPADAGGPPPPTPTPPLSPAPTLRNALSPSPRARILDVRCARLWASPSSVRRCPKQRGSPSRKWKLSSR